MHLAWVGREYFEQIIWQWEGVPGGGPCGTHAPGSLHGQHFPSGRGKAWDSYADTGDAKRDAQSMYNFAAWLHRHAGKWLTEGIHNPNLSIKYGQVRDPSFWGSDGKTWDNHRDHVHCGIE